MTYKKIKDGAVLAYDVDDTILLWNTPADYSDAFLSVKCGDFIEVAAVNWPIVNHIKKAKQRGNSIVVWSRAGSDWAEAVVKALHLDEYVDVVMPKLSGHFDDVKDPVDKLGKWRYINYKGELQD